MTEFSNLPLTQEELESGLVEWSNSVVGVIHTVRDVQEHGLLNSNKEVTAKFFLELREHVRNLDAYLVHKGVIDAG